MPENPRRYRIAATVAVLAAAMVLWRSERSGSVFRWWPAAAAAGEVVCADCNVVLVLVDTLRADHLASYGYSRITSPALDRFAHRHLQFENVRSQSSCTFPSVNSLLTSRPVFEFLDPRTRPGIPPGVATLPEILRRRGWATAAVSASPIVRRSPGRENPVGGFGRGFEHFDESAPWAPAERVTELAIQAVERLPQPFFLYLHYMDPHDPLTPGGEFRGTFSSEYRGPWAFVARGELNPIQPMIEDGTIDRLNARDLQHLVDLYDESILAFDSGLRSLLEQLDASGSMRKTIVVIAADHGESFLEHGTVKHCRTVWDTETRVPLLIAIPGLGESRRLAPWVENVDLVPTVLDYLGVFYDPAAFAGRSLRPLIEQGEAPRRPAFSSMASFTSVNDDRYKLIHDLGEPRFMLFDLLADPGEKRDLSTAEPEILRSLRHQLEAWTRSADAETSDAERLLRAEEIEDQLEALGYL